VARRGSRARIGKASKEKIKEANAKKKNCVGGVSKPSRLPRRGSIAQPFMVSGREVGEVDTFAFDSTSFGEKGEGERERNASSEATKEQSDDSVPWGKTEMTW